MFGNKIRKQWAQRAHNCTRGIAPLHKLYPMLPESPKGSSGSPPGAPCSASLSPPPPKCFLCLGRALYQTHGGGTGSLSQDPASPSHATGPRVDSTPKTTDSSCSWDAERDPLSNSDRTTGRLLVPRHIIPVSGTGGPGAGGRVTQGWQLVGAGPVAVWAGDSLWRSRQARVLPERPRWHLVGRPAAPTDVRPRSLRNGHMRLFTRPHHGAGIPAVGEVVPGAGVREARPALCAGGWGGQGVSPVTGRPPRGAGSTSRSR